MTKDTDKKYSQNKKYNIVILETCVDIRVRWNTWASIPAPSFTA